MVEVITLRRLQSGKKHRWTRVIRRWQVYCNTHNISSTQPTPHEFRDFLTFISKFGMVGSPVSTGTMENVKSLVSKYLLECSNSLNAVEIGKHPLIQDYVRQRNSINPKRPKTSKDVLIPQVVPVKAHLHALCEEGKPFRVKAAFVPIQQNFCRMADIVGIVSPESFLVDRVADDGMLETMLEARPWALNPSTFRIFASKEGQAKRMLLTPHIEIVDGVIFSKREALRLFRKYVNEELIAKGNHKYGYLFYVCKKDKQTGQLQVQRMANSTFSNYVKEVVNITLKKMKALRPDFESSDWRSVTASWAQNILHWDVQKILDYGRWTSRYVFEQFYRRGVAATHTHGILGNIRSKFFS